MPKETIDTIETFEENGVIYQQEIKYDPEAKEAVITVPAHGDRKAISVVVGEKTTAVVSDTSCVIEDTPDDLDVDEFSNNKTETNGTISASKPKVYKIYTDLGEMSAEEQESLSEGTKNACGSKAIHKTKVETVDEETFNNFKKSQGISSMRTVNGFSMAKRSKKHKYGFSRSSSRSHMFRATCSNVTVILNTCKHSD